MKKDQQTIRFPQNEITTVLGQRGSGKTSWIKKRLPEIPRFILWDTLGEYTEYTVINDMQNLFVYMNNVQKGVFQVVYNSLEDGDLEKVCKIVAAIGTCCFIIEEVDHYATPYDCPYELKRLLKIGRHWDISMIFVSRRPAEINRLITSQSQRFVCFRMFEPGDIRYLKSIIGPEADELISLEVLHYLDWKHGTIERGEITWNTKK